MGSPGDHLLRRPLVYRARNDHDRDLRPSRPDPVDRLDSLAVGQVQVEEDQVELLGDQSVGRLPHGSGMGDLQRSGARPPEDRLDEEDVARIVLDVKDAQSHARRRHLRTTTKKFWSR